jgi:penicillin-binding protein 2
MSIIHAPREPELEPRILIFPGVIVAALVLVLLRLWYVQVVKGEELRDKARMYQRSSITRLAPRGLIYDRHGTLLAGVRPEIVVTAKPGIVRKNPWVLDKLSTMLQVDRKKLEEKVNDAAWKPFLASAIHVGVPLEVATRIAESAEEMPGIGVETQAMRYYPDSRSFTHILGYVWVPNPNDVRRLQDKGLKPADYVGKLGVEYVYEDRLMGRPGIEEMEVDAKRRPLRVAGRDNPVPGQQLVLSIDGNLQRLGTELMQGYRGSIVAIDPKNGEVLCLVSSPTYDQTLFHNGISTADYKKLMDDPAIPLLNRAIASFNSPGSTFKIVTAMAAAEAGRLSPNDRVNCPGYYPLGSRRGPRCMGRHGAIAFHSAMQKSCNTFFCEMGMRAGPTVLRKEAERVGLGQRLGVDLFGEGKGIVPTDEWISRWRKPPIWYTGDTLNLAIGQGELQASPLQMAHMMALVANNGVAYRPRVVRAVRSPYGDGEAAFTEAEVLHRIQAPDWFWNQLRASLVAVVDGGTATSAKIPGLNWGGKTGSAEHKKGQKTHSWYVGFAPAEDPKIAICVFVEAAGHGGAIAAPMAGQIVRRYLLGAEESAASSSASALAAQAQPPGSPSSR